MDDLYRLLSSWDQELSAVIDRVRTIIGSNHWPTDGAYKEQIVQNWIRRFISADCSVGGGFIYSPGVSKNLSKQIDVLIARKSVHPFWLEEGDLMIVPPQTLVAMIEVKSKLTRVELRKALVNIEAGFSVCSDSGFAGELWAGIYAFDQQAKYSCGEKGVKALVQDLFDEATDAGVSMLGRRINVYVHGSTIARIENKSSKLVAQGYEVGDLAAGILLSDLISQVSLDAEKSEDLLDCIDRFRFKRIEV